MSQILENPSGSKYSDVQRRQAIAEYAVLGSVQRVSDNTGIPRQTISGWKKQDWWLEALSEVRLQNKDIIESGYEQAIMKGLNSIIDRIDNGDTYIDKDGNQGKKPVSLRDLSTATGIAYDKLRLHRNQPTTIKAESTDARLADLANKVRELQGGTVTIDQEPEKD